MTRRTILLGAAAIGVAALLLLLLHVDPATLPWFPKCPIKMLTGWECPGCGSTRALHALLHGHPGRALGFNPLLVVGVPYALTLIGLEYFGGRRRWPRLREAMTSRAACRIILGVLVVYMLLRNLL